jgi:hypothetical protein
MQHVWDKREIHIAFRWINLKERDHFEDLDVNGKIMLKWISKNTMGEDGFNSPGSE